VPAITACFAAAFHEDPVWGHWAFPDETTRNAGLRQLMGFWVKSHVENATVWITEGCESAAAWVAPGEDDLTPAEQQQFVPFVADLFGDRGPELNDLFNQFDEHHPNEPHWYLSIWGTQPEFAGQGFGSALIKECLAVVDASGMPAYLESCNPVNVARYEALGFEPRSEFSVPGSPVLTTMWRPGQ
jgi:GNAT superfamily N-acetyltransferase